MENQTEEEVITTEEEVITDDETKITNKNDPEKVTLVKDDPICRKTSEGDQIIGEGKSILKPDHKAKEKGQRSWFDFS